MKVRIPITLRAKHHLVAMAYRASAIWSVGWHLPFVAVILNHSLHCIVIWWVEIRQIRFTTWFASVLWIDGISLSSLRIVTRNRIFTVTFHRFRNLWKVSTSTSISRSWSNSAYRSSFAILRNCLRSRRVFSCDSFFMTRTISRSGFSYLAFMAFYSGSLWGSWKGEIRNFGLLA